MTRGGVLYLPACLADWLAAPILPAWLRPLRAPLHLCECLPACVSVWSWPLPDVVRALEQKAGMRALLPMPCDTCAQLAFSVCHVAAAAPPGRRKFSLRAPLCVHTPHSASYACVHFFRPGFRVLECVSV